MSFDPITYAAVQQLKKAAVPKYECVWSSRTVTVPKNAELTIRAMGAGGGGGRGTGAKGGAGGTVALKTLHVSAGDELDVVIPAGGDGGTSALPSGSSGGTLLVELNASEILSIAGGGSNGTAALDPTGADWFVKSTPPTGTGGGSAMLLDGFSATATATGAGGAGVLGNGGESNGGGLLFDNGGGGFALVDMTILKFTENLPNPDQGVAFTGGTSGTTGEAGGFGAGGGSGTTGRGGQGGFGGGGGGGISNLGGVGGFGGGGGGSTNTNGGGGGQGWVTLEWRYV